MTESSTSPSANGSQAADRPNVENAIAAFQDNGRFFYWGSGRDTQLRMLGHLVRYSDLMLVLTSPSGSGKTTLLRAFLQADTSGLSAWSLQAQEFMSAELFWAALCSGVPALSRQVKCPVESRIDTLRELAKQCQSDGDIGVLTIDDAHLLAEDALGLLADVSIGLKGVDGLRVVIAGEPELQAHLEHSRLIERMQGNCHYLTLEPLDGQGCQDYIGQRLGASGLSIDLFAAEELDFIREQGKGLPGGINQACIRILNGGAPVRSNSVGLPTIPKAHAYAILAVLVLIVGTFLFSSEGGDKSASETPGVSGTGTLADPTVKLIQAPKIVSARPELDRTLAAGERLELSGAEAAMQNIPVLERAALAPVDSKSTSEPKATASESSAPVTSLEEKKTAEAAKPATEQKALATDSNAKPAAVTQTILTAETGDKHAPSTESTLAPDLPLGATQKEPAEKTPESDRMEAFLAERKPQQRTEEWLLEQSPGSYTVQVLGAHNEQAVAKFIASQANPQDFIYFRTGLKGRDWFVIVIGLFENRAQAVASISGLPQPLRKNKPYARSLESIHKAIVEDRPS